MAAVPQPIPNFTSSLLSFYDDVVYWEMAKNANRFFVTFEKGNHSIPNNKQESIGTMEIDYPHVTSNSGSSASFALGATRNQARFDVFLEEEEKTAGDNHNYNGFITVTELKGTRFFQTTLTSSITQSTTYTYGITASNSDELTAIRTVDTSYFYPYSSHQLSVLRRSPTLVVDLDKESELPNGIGTKGIVLIPEHTHPDIKANLDEILKKAGY